MAQVLQHTTDHQSTLAHLETVILWGAELAQSWRYNIARAWLLRHFAKTTHASGMSLYL